MTIAGEGVVLAALGSPMIQGQRATAAALFARMLDEIGIKSKL